MKIQCPRCKAAHRVDPARIPDGGIHARCTPCGARFFIRKKTPQPPPRPVATPPPPLTACANCEQKIGKLEPRHKFRSHIVCHECHQRLQQVERPRPAAPEPVQRSSGDNARGSSLDTFRTGLPRPAAKSQDASPSRNGGRPLGFRDQFLSFFSHDMAIDLGTANTLVYLRRRGIVLNESSVVAFRMINGHGREVVAVGLDAKRMMGKTPSNVKAIRPMRDGVIADFEVAGEMLNAFIRKVRRRTPFFKPRMIIAVPSGITQVERRAVKESAEQAGARAVFLISEPMAAAIGAGLPITEATCNMVVDIGGGTTEVAVISLGGIVASRSIRIAGDEMDAAILRYIKRKYNFIIGERTAEMVKIRIGNACPDETNPERIEVKGWEVMSGRPRIFWLNAVEVREAIEEQLQAIVEAMKMVLDRTPQELTATVIDNGIVITGGVGLLKNLDQFLAETTGLPVRVADDPLSTIVMGSGKTLDSAALFRQVVDV